MTIHRLNAHNL